MNYYSHHIGDFNNATRHLTVVERALYRELIELYYTLEEPLPADDFDRLARRVLCPDEHKAALVDVLNEFFELSEGVYRQKRCDEEIAKFHSRNEQAKAAGKASAERRLSERSTAVEHPSNQPITNNQEPRTKVEKRSPSGSRLPSEWSPNDADIAYARAQGLSGKDIEVQAEAFRDHWVAAAGAKGRKADWPATWRTWVRRSTEFAPKLKAVDKFAGAM